MKKKVAFIGAGSYIFTRSVVNDLVLFPAFDECEIALMDIDNERLQVAEAACNKIVKALGSHATVTTTMNRAKALEGADGVLCTVFNGGMNIWRKDLEIPMKYGVDINIGDTRNVAGIFRAIRNIPLMLDICADIEKYCPKAVFLNYTNPMSMLCGAMQKYTKVDVTGLCHSVQGTAAMLATWLGYKPEDVDYLCAGVNHQAFYLRFEHEGEDLYPRLRDLITQDEYYNKEIVRNEMFKHLDYYVTESSGHNSEYTAWFRKRPDLIEKYCTHGTNWNPGLHAFTISERERRARTWRQEFDDYLKNEEVKSVRGNEYAANIFNARFGDHTPYFFNGNVLNEGSIENLPYDACVEVPVVVDRKGLSKIHVGKLPAHLAILVSHTAAMESLVVEGAMEKSKRKIFQAVCMDPLTSAVCSLDEIDRMCNELFEFNRDFLGEYR